MEATVQLTLTPGGESRVEESFSSKEMGGGSISAGISLLPAMLDGRVAGLPDPEAEEESWALASSSNLILASARIARVASARRASWFYEIEAGSKMIH